MVEWRCNQVFGGPPSLDSLSDVDCITSIEFDQKGELIAAGDRGGRILVLKKNSDLTSQNSAADYHVYVEFQSHDPEFDYLRSIEIEAKINKVKWLPPQNRAHFLLSTNSKTVKLWKIQETKIYDIHHFNASSSSSNTENELHVPTLTVRQTGIKCKTRRTFDLGHRYHIHSISLNSDGEHFLSSDEFRITLWNLNISNEGFSVVDTTPETLESLREVITAAEFHPQHCNIFVYSTSRGNLYCADMRQRSLCDQTSKAFVASSKRTKGFFSDIVNSISCVKFSPDGRFIFARDYFYVNVWDMRMESQPLKCINIQDFLAPKLYDLYENDALFDKFEIAINNEGNLLLSGAYDNCFLLYDLKNDVSTQVELPKVELGGSQSSVSYPRYRLRQIVTNKQTQKSIKKPKSNSDAIDFTKKVLHVAWHPRENALAVVSNNSIFLYNHANSQNNNQ